MFKLNIIGAITLVIIICLVNRRQTYTQNYSYESMDGKSFCSYANPNGSYGECIAGFKNLPPLIPGQQVPDEFRKELGLGD